MTSSFILENKDYISSTHTLKFDPGQSSSNSSLQCMNLTIINDRIVEDSEMFFLALHPSPGYETLVKFTGSPTRIIIKDDDGKQYNIYIIMMFGL